MCNSEVSFFCFSLVKIAATGKIIILKVNGSDTVGSIKLKIAAKEHMTSRNSSSTIRFLRTSMPLPTCLSNRNPSSHLCVNQVDSSIYPSRLQKDREIIQSLAVKPADTVGDVKAKMYGHAHGHVRVLIFNENVLEDSAILADLHIVDGSTLLTLTGNSVEFMKIFVNTFTGKTISLLVNPKSTIKHVKWEIECEEDIPCNEQALIYNNMVLEDSSTLVDFHIYRKSTLT
ncbi:putative Ubiquitin-like domain-containing protein [Helianthus anomalus]